MGARVIVPGLLAAALAACASAGAPATAMQAAPSSPWEGRREISDLERQIEQGRVALGMPARQQPTRTPPESAGSEGHALDAAPEAKPAPPPAPSVEAAEPVVRAKKDDHCGVGSCRYTRAICAAASRICGIARYLDDEDARSRCARAEQDCQDARKVTRGSCPGC